MKTTKTAAIFALILIFALATLAACSKAGQEAGTFAPALDVDAQATPSGGSAAPDASAPDASAPDASAPDESASAQSYGHTARAEVTATVAYAYLEGESTTLYGAAEYKNTGDCPVYVKAATLRFQSEGATLEHEYEPLLGEYESVLPGESSFIAVWVRSADATPDAAVTLAVDLRVEECAAPRVTMSASELYVADNYPGFSTLSGALSVNAGGSCTMNTVYVGFYAEDGSFLGVWRFTKNAVIEEGDRKKFVVNMQDFPKNDLGAETASFKAAAFGFEL